MTKLGYPVQRSNTQRILDKLPCSEKTLRNTGIALAITVIAVGALLAYMHFSGIGISKAGFAQLGQQIGSTAKLTGKEIGKLATKAWGTTPGKVAIVSAGTLLAGSAIGVAGWKIDQHNQPAPKNPLVTEDFDADFWMEDE